VDDEIDANFAAWELSYQYVKRLLDLNRQLKLCEDKLRHTIGKAKGLQK